MSTSRRTFLGTSVSAPAAFAAAKSPNDKLQIGIIGTGGRYMDHFRELSRAKNDENVTVTAVCDVWKPNLAKSCALVEKTFGSKPKATADYRELLNWSEVDAVILTAPDFTHSQMLEDAIRAGKDVLVEKPMGTKFDEAKRAFLAVKKSDRVVQVGTQRRSDPGLIGAAAYVQSGVLGRVTRVDMEVHFQEPRWRRAFDMVQEKDLDWNRFLMGRSDRPFDARRFRQWQLFRDYTNGLPGLWMSHFIDLVPWFLGDPYPKSVAANGGVMLWQDGRETEDVFSALLEYPKGTLVRFAISLTNTAGARNLWYGTKGTLDADTLTISGKGSTQKDRIEQEIQIPKQIIESHLVNFLRCVRSRQTPRADIQAGFSHAVANCMAAESLRTGRVVRFDASTLEMI